MINQVTKQSKLSIQFVPLFPSHIVFVISVWLGLAQLTFKREQFVEPEKEKSSKGIYN